MVTKMERMPADVRARVAKTILERSIAAGWEDLNSRQRSGLYNAWVVDPQIGGVIGEYLPPEKIRVWIKDGPMKEYARARRGLGPYAQYVPDVEPMEEEITSRVLGAGWHFVPGSVDVKPSRFRASDGETTVAVIWGMPSDLKHIVWAWLISSNLYEVLMVVITSPYQPLTRDERAEIRRMSRKLGTAITVIDR